MADERVAEEGETPFRLRTRDAELLVGVLAILQGHLLGGDDSRTTDQIRDRLARAGVLTDESSVGEAAVVIGDLGQQVRYANGDYDDKRPDAERRLTAHYLSMPSRENAEACRAEVAGLSPVRTEINESPEAGLRLLVAFPELAPDAAFHTRSAELSAIAVRHGGRLTGSSGAWW